MRRWRDLADVSLLWILLVPCLASACGSPASMRGLSSGASPGSHGSTGGFWTSSEVEAGTSIFPDSPAAVFDKLLQQCLRTADHPALPVDTHALRSGLWQLLIPKAMQGLREFPSSVIVPMMQISWTMFSILSGGIYFHEYRVFTAFTGTMFAVGVAVTGPAPPPCSTAWLSPARPCIVQSTGKQAGLANGHASAADAAANMVGALCPRCLRSMVTD